VQVRLASHMDRKKEKALLARTALELVVGQELLREKKKQIKKAKAPLAAANAKHEAHTIATAVEGIKMPRRLLKQKLASGAHDSSS
jgi:hypothetical protein